MIEVRPRGARDHALYRILDRTRSGAFDLAALLGDSQDGAAAIVGIAAPPDQLRRLEPLQDSGQGARMDVEHLGDLAGGDARKTGHDPDHQPSADR